MQLINIIKNDLLCLSLCSSLSTKSLFSLSVTSRLIHATLITTSGVWRSLEFAEHENLTTAIPRLLKRPEILYDLRILILDNTSISHQFLCDILTNPSLRIAELSIRGCANVNIDHFSKAIKRLNKDSQPCSLKLIRVMGHPEIRGGSAASIARDFIDDLGDLIRTDIPGFCCGVVALETESICNCGMRQFLCPKCRQRRKTCLSCNTWKCERCDPRILYVKTLCYDCGPRCTPCKMTETCLWCGAHYCVEHRERKSEKRKYCDWCCVGGRKR